MWSAASPTRLGWPYRPIPPTRSSVPADWRQALLPPKQKPSVKTGMVRRRQAPEHVDRRSSVEVDVLGRRRSDLRLPVEALRAAMVADQSGRAAEVVDGDGGEACLGQSLREGDVEAVQAADVREDDDSRPWGVGRKRTSRRELCAVARRQRDVPVSPTGPICGGAGGRAAGSWHIAEV